MRKSHDDLSRRMVGLDPACDEALEVLRLGLLATSRSGRVERFMNETLEAWSRRVLAHAEKVGRIRDRDEVGDAARLWIIERLAEFRPTEDGGDVAVFLRARFSWFRSDARRAVNPALQPHGRYVVAGAIGRAREVFVAAHHREPSETELRTVVEALLFEQTASKIRESAPGIGEDEIARKVSAKLSRNGVTAALRDFTLVRQDALEPLSVRLEEESDTDRETQGWGVALPVVEDPDIDERDPEEDYMRLMEVALGDQQWARAAFAARTVGSESPDSVTDNRTLRAFADAEEHTVAELKDVLGSARSRITAPHAQWAHLSPSLRVTHHS